MHAEALVIHLARATARRPQAERIVAALPLETTIVDAVDGRSLQPEALAAFRPRLLAPRYPFALSATEIACFHSHRACWRIIVERGWAFGLIVEDDVVVDDARLASSIDEALTVLAPTGYLRFPVKPERENGPAVHRGAGFALIEPELPGLGMQMQLVGREAASRLLAATENFDRPVDSLVQMQWLHGARVLSAHPALIREISVELGGTVVQNKTMPILQKLSHEVRRPLIRWAVRRANARWRESTGWNGAGR